MKTRLRRNRAAKIPTSCWLAYGGASAATALVGTVAMTFGFGLEPLS